MPKSPKTAPPRSNLTLEQHWQIIQYKKEHPTLSTAEIARVFAEKFNHPTLNQSTVSRTLNKEDRLRPFSTHTTRKKISQVRCPEVEEALMKWYSAEMERGNTVTGPMLRSQAIRIADDMGIPEDARPKYSNGWLDCYKSRHQLKFGNRPQQPAPSSTPAPHPQPQAQAQVQAKVVSQVQVQAQPVSQPPVQAQAQTQHVRRESYSHHARHHSGSSFQDHRHASTSPLSPVDRGSYMRATPEYITDRGHERTYSYPRSPIHVPTHGHMTYEPYQRRWTSDERSVKYEVDEDALSCCSSSYSNGREYGVGAIAAVPAGAAPGEDEMTISKAVKSLRLHIEQCPTLEDNRSHLLANMKAIESAVSPRRSGSMSRSPSPTYSSHRHHPYPRLQPITSASRSTAQVREYSPYSPSADSEPRSPVSPLSSSSMAPSPMSPRPELESTQGQPQRRQRWLDLVTSPTPESVPSPGSSSNPRHHAA